MTSSTPPVLRWVVRVVLLALVYALSGRLSMLLAVPPGFASAIFPPVGIALGAVLIGGSPMLIGAFIGSTMLNVSISVSAGAPLSIGLLPVAMGIAAGSTFQVGVGALLIRVALRGDLTLRHERDIVLFLLLGGPLSCLIGASVGVAVLHEANIVPAAEVMHNWFNWWVGDSIGVLVMTPLMLIFFAQPRDVWRARINTVAIPLLIASVLVICAFLWSSKSEQQQNSQRFFQQAQMMASSVKKRLDLNINAVRALERFFSSSQNVSRQEFSRFVADMKTTYPSIHALSWNPRVRADQRKDFERWLSEEGLSDKGILERNQQGQWIKAGERDQYVVVTYIEPQPENQKLVGVDIAVDSVRHSAMQRAATLGELAISGPVTLLQEAQTQKSVLLYYPVYAEGDIPATQAERENSIRGFATAAVRMGDLIHIALAEYPSKNYQLQLLDVTEPAREALIVGGINALPPYAQRMIWQEEWSVAGRVWQLRIAPSLAYLSTQHSQQSWAILAGGLILSSLLGAFLLSTSGRTYRIQQLVNERTLALSSILSNAVEAIISFDDRYQILAANPAAGALFGCDNTTLTGRNLCTLIPALEQERDHVLGLTREFSAHRVDGQNIAVEVSLSLVDINGQRTYTCMGHDVSERKKMERLKSEFVATVSHELRTPLTSISGALGLLANGVVGLLPVKAQSLVDIAKSNSERLIAIVNDILDIERLESGQINIKPEVLELLPLLRLAIEQNEGYAERYRVRLRLDQTPPTSASIKVLVDQQRFLQIMANLISNAIKFSPPEHDVTVNIELAEHSVKIEVSDQGAGVPEEFRDRIFQKFAQADATDARQRGGTGLGLSITKVLVERMQGYINYHSVAGKGSTFYVIFPLQ